MRDRFASYFDPPEGNEICDVCGSHFDSCICPECGVCQSQGDPGCYVPCTGHGLTLTLEQIAARAQADKAIEEENRFWSEYAEEIDNENESAIL